MEILGTDGNDTLTNDPVNGNGNGLNTNNTFVGGGGDDTIVAGPDSVVNYRPNGQPYQDNDTLIEESGNNTLTGGYGNDIFKFRINFDIDSREVTDTFDLAVPTQTSGANTNGVWNSWLDALAAWRAEMSAAYGADANTTTTSTSYTYGAKNKQAGSATYDNTFSWTEEVITTNTSTNLITDFGNGNDSIQLAGVTAAQFAEYGSLTEDGNGNTIIAIGTFSITVAGADMAAVAASLSFV